MCGCSAFGIEMRGIISLVLRMVQRNLMEAPLLNTSTLSICSIGGSARLIGSTSLLLPTTATGILLISRILGKPLDFQSGSRGHLSYLTAVYGRNLEVGLTVLAENGCVRLGGPFLNQVLHCEIRKLPNASNRGINPGKPIWRVLG